MKAKLVYQAYGNGIAVGISGDKSEVDRMANWLYNFGATDGDLIRESETFGFILTDHERLLQAFINLYVMQLQRKATFKGKRGGVIAEATVLAEQRVAAIPQESFLRQSDDTLAEAYQIGNDDLSEIPSKRGELANY